MELKGTPKEIADPIKELQGQQKVEGFITLRKPYSPSLQVILVKGGQMKSRALDVLTQQQIQMLKVAVFNNIPVLITGNRHFPTGKSYLCDFLRNLGADVREQWEIEEGEHEDIQSNGKNNIYFTIALNQKLEIEKF